MAKLAIIQALAIVFLVLIRPNYGQISNLCTTAMLQSFNSCMNFVTNVGNNGNSSPTSDCCDSLKSLMSSGRDCLCLIVTGGVPFRVPINRSIAASLPKACRKDDVPIECKAMGSPLPAPGPTTDLPGGPPQGANPRSPWLPEPNTPGSDGGGGGGGGGGDGSSFTPPGIMTPDNEPQFPMTPPGVRPDLSAAKSSSKSFFLLPFSGAIIMAFFMYS